MLLDKTIRENLDGKYLTIYGESFREGIEYAADIDIPQIQLRNNTKCNSIDFKELEKNTCFKGDFFCRQYHKNHQLRLHIFIEGYSEDILSAKTKIQNRYF